MMTDPNPALVESVAKVLSDVAGTADWDGLWDEMARAAITAARASIRAEVVEEVIRLLAAREDLMNAVAFRHAAEAIRELKENSDG